MNASVQSTNVQYAVIQLSGTKKSSERLILAYPNEETLRDLIEEPCIVRLGFGSREEAISAARTTLVEAAASRREDELASDAAEHAQIHSFGKRVNPISSLRGLASGIVQFVIVAALFIVYSKNIGSAIVRAVLSGSV